MSDVSELKKRILDEGHRSSLSIHPGATKMYKDLKRLFWWPGMKKDIAEFVYACLVCQKSKIEHQKPTRLMQPLFVLEWKWDSISMQPLVIHFGNSFWTCFEVKEVDSEIHWSVSDFREDWGGGISCWITTTFIEFA